MKKAVALLLLLLLPVAVWADLTASDFGSGSQGSTTADITVAVDITAGDLIVVTAATDNATAATATGVTDSAGNTYTARTAVDETGHLRQFYCLSADTGGTGVDVTVAFSDGSWATRMAMVEVFTPDAGDTVSLADSASASGYGTALASGNVSSVETDSVTVAGFMLATASLTHSAHDIDGQTPTVNTSPEGRIGQFYYIGAVSAGQATVTASANGSWAIEALTFDSASGGGGGGGPVPQAMHYRRLMQ